MPNTSVNATRHGGPIYLVSGQSVRAVSVALPRALEISRHKERICNLSKRKPARFAKQQPVSSSPTTATESISLAFIAQSSKYLLALKHGSQIQFHSGGNNSLKWRAEEMKKKS